MNGKQAERREQWRQMIAEQEKSGQSIRVYCQGQGVSEYAFYSWRQRLRKELPVTFALVETKATSEAVVIDVVLATGDRLRIPGDAATLRMVVSVLRERA
jgi:hypothetical protein